MSPLQFIPLGTGNAFSALSYSSCLAVGAGDDWLLIDCPHPIRKMLREGSVAAGVPLDLDRIFAVALTHLHGDHVSGLEGYGYFSHYALRRKAQIFAHPNVAEKLWPGHLAAGMEWSFHEDGSPRRRTLGDFFDLRLLSEAAAVQAGPFAIECRRTVHSVPTTALRIRAAGRSLGYSADTAFDPALIDWLTEADLIVHETGEAGLHTPYAKLAALPAALRERMRLIHYADDFDVAGSVIPVLQQGRLYQV